MSVQPYYEDEVRKTRKTVRKWKNSSTLAFILVTDIHYKSTVKDSGEERKDTVDYMVENMKAVAEGLPIKFIMNLGDNTDGCYQDYDELKQNCQYVQDKLLSIGLPYYYAIGNHDTNSYRGASKINISQYEELYTGYLNDYDNVVFNPGSNKTEYYFDLEKHNMRVVVLNTSYDSRFGYSESTAPWLESCALQFDGTILLCEHCSAIFTQNMCVDEMPNREAVEAALRAYKGRIIQFCGHSHCDYYYTAYDEENAPWMTIFNNLQRCSIRRTSDIGDITVGHDDEKFKRPKREEGTYTEDCWSVVVISEEQGIVGIARFGAGKNRMLNFMITPSDEEDLLGSLSSLFG